MYGSDIIIEQVDILSLFQTVLVPVLMISGIGLFILIIQTRYGRVVDRIRTINNERLELIKRSIMKRISKAEKTWIDYRLQDLQKQMSILVGRGKLLKDSLRFTFISIFTFIISSLLLFVELITKIISVMEMNGLNGCLLPEDIFAVFRRLGFSKYEAGAYVTLCACGRLKMGQLAKYSSGPQSKIYKVLGSLERKNAAVVSRVRPKTAENIPLKQIVSLRVKQYLQDAQMALEYIESIQNTEAFKHLYHTRRIALRSNGRVKFNCPPTSGIFE